MEWWMWILLGLVLLLAEIVTPSGFFIFFFAIGAIIVGMLAGFNAAGPVWFQIILFSILSLLTLWLFRERLLRLMHAPQQSAIDSLIGETAVMLEDIPLNGFGKAEMRGSSWNARNVGQKPLARGERGRVERVEGLMIFVRADQG